MGLVVTGGGLAALSLATMPPAPRPVVGSEAPAAAPAVPAAVRGPAADVHFAPGERVFHQKFGTGTVMAVDGDKLAVSFDRAGDKHIVARFLVPADGMDDVPF